MTKMDFDHIELVHLFFETQGTFVGIRLLLMSVEIVSGPATVAATVEQRSRTLT